MKLKVSELYSAVVVLTTIINEKRALPQRGQYRVARAHGTLATEFKIVDVKREDLIREFGSEVVIKQEDGSEVLQSGAFEVKADSPRWKEFAEAWDKICAEEIEVQVEPIPLSTLGDVGSITAQEFIALGPLVTD